MTHVEIPVSGGLVALVDAEDADAVLQHTWSALRAGNTVYAHRGIKREDGRRATQTLHQFITGYPLTDHHNGNGLDNRRVNLREATQAQNLCNQLRVPGPSGFKGVTWFKRDGTWKAQIMKNGKNYHLGYHQTAEAAAKAYDDASRRLHGEFGTLNFPKAGERAGRILKETV